MDTFVDKWLLLVIEEIFSRMVFIILLVGIGQSARSGTSMQQIDFSHIVYQGVGVALAAVSYTQ